MTRSRLDAERRIRVKFTNLQFTLRPPHQQRIRTQPVNPCLSHPRLPSSAKRRAFDAPLSKQHATTLRQTRPRHRVDLARLQLRTSPVRKPRLGCSRRACGYLGVPSAPSDPEVWDDALPLSRSARSSAAVIVTILPSIITKIPVFVWMATSLALRAARFSASSARGIQAGLTVSVFMAV